MKYFLALLFAVRLMAVDSVSVTYNTSTKVATPTNLVFVGPKTATVPASGTDIVNKTALDAAVVAGGVNKLDTTNGVAVNLQSTSLSSLYPNSVVKREYIDYVGSTNINNWMAIQTWGDSLTEGSGVGGVTSSNTYPAQLGTYSGFRVANGGVGGETAPQILVRQTAASNTWFRPTIIWAGRNEYWYPTNVLNGVSNMVANLRAGGNTNRFLVLSVLNGNYSGDERGGANYQIITNINAQFAAAYGSNYLDVRAYLVSRYNPLVAQDVLDYANDIPPSSLRSDGIHLNSSGYPAVAAYILTNGMATLRGAWGPSVRPSGVTAILRQPGPIGSEVKNSGDFTSLTGNTLGVGSVTVTNGLTAQSLASVSSSVGTGTATNSYISPAFTVTGSGYSSTAYLSGNGALWVFTGGLAPDANGTRDLGIGGLAWRNITATGAITAGSAALASETLGSLVVTNGITAGSLTASGAVASVTSTVGSAVATNSFKAPAILVQGSGSSFGTLSLAGDNSAIITDKKLMPSADGTLSLGYGYNSYQWLHGFFSGKLWSDSLQTTNGAIAALTAGTVAVTNAVTAASVTASGALAGATANITGAVNSGSVATGSLAVTNSFTAASAVITNSLTVGGTLTGGASRFNTVYVTNAATANVVTLYSGANTVSAYLGGSGTRWVLTGGFDPASDATYSLGQGGLRWLNGVFSGIVQANTLQSTVATGTSPLAVASTTEVANLRSATATALATGRTINGVSFDGTANITVTAAAATLTGLGTGLATALGLTPTGSGVIVLATNAVLTTPALGAATATSLVASAGVTGSTLTSTVATGTPPLVVASTTRIPNLNADLIDGLQKVGIQPANANLTNVAALTVQSLPSTIISVTENTQTGTTYTVASTDNGKVVTLNNASAITVTVPTLSAGFSCTFIQKGAGQVTFTTSGTTISNAHSQTKTFGQYSVVTLYGLSSTAFVLAGDTGT